MLLTLGTGSRLGLTDEVPDQVKVAFSIGEAFLFRVPERQPLHDQLGSVFAHRCKTLREQPVKEAIAAEDGSVSPTEGGSAVSRLICIRQPDGCLGSAKMRCSMVLSIRDSGI